MFLEGLGVPKNLDKAFICLKDAASRGNVYAMGHLSAYYYRCRLYTKAVDIAARSEASEFLHTIPHGDSELVERFA